MLFIHLQCLYGRLVFSEFVDLVVDLIHGQFIVCFELYIFVDCFFVLDCHLLIDRICFLEISQQTMMYDIEPLMNRVYLIDFVLVIES